MPIYMLEKKRPVTNALAGFEPASPDLVEVGLTTELLLLVTSCSRGPVEDAW